MTTKNALWFGDADPRFRGSDPFYFEPSEFAWVKRVEENWQVIRDEMMALVADEHQMRPYPDKSMTSRPNQWKTFGMMFWTLRSKANCGRCPKTWALLRDIPNLCAASFNLLEPGTTIKPHNGDTNAIIRCHMGLSVPASAPRCAFRVGSEIRSWENGKFLMFCDAHEHTAWNNTAERRYILVLDIMRPEFVAYRRAVASRVLASIALSIYYQRFSWLKRWFGARMGKTAVFNLLRAFHYVPVTLSAIRMRK